MTRRAHKRRNSASWGVLLLVFITSLGAGAYTARAASGTIDATDKYAWSNIGGWVNFAPTHSTVTVTDTGLTGYAWSANDGWINLAPTQGGVKNDGAGNLSGFAWDAGAGWVNFTGVTINSSGKFTGSATGAGGYILNFDCANCNVVTTWRPTTTTTTTTTSSGGGSISPVYIPPSPSQTGPSPSQQQTGQPNPLPGSSPAQNTSGGNSPPSAGSSGAGAVGASGQTVFPPFPGQSASGPGSSRPLGTRAPTSTPVGVTGSSSGANFVHTAVVPVSIIAIALFFIFLIRFIL